MRGKKAKKRKLKPDLKYKSAVVTKFINYIMQDGKKNVAREVMYEALEKMGKDAKMKPIDALDKSLQNIMPKVEVRSRRVGGSNYQVPSPVRDDRQLTLALRWIIKAAKDNRGNSSFADSIARELVAAIKREGNAYKKREDVEKMAEANRAFAHFQW